MESVGAVHKPTCLTIRTESLKAALRALEKGAQIWCTSLLATVSYEQSGNKQGEGREELDQSST